MLHACVGQFFVSVLPCFIWIDMGIHVTPEVLNEAIIRLDSGT